MTEERFKELSGKINGLKRLHDDTSGIKDEGHLFAGVNTSRVFELSEAMIELELGIGWLTQEEADKLQKQIEEARK